MAVVARAQKAKTGGGIAVPITDQTSLPLEDRPDSGCRSLHEGSQTLLYVHVIVLYGTRHVAARSPSLRQLSAAIRRNTIPANHDRSETPS